ncbi:mitochondrial inner membrane translocase 9-like protein-like [Scleropages formosus]|uniref:Mitochondrial import inner membrane translocase subunit n=2 Tax=Scleropages formosus TaxID=113540 RepID=A0A0N8K025_SCLFO|nr:mitochondrial inner membrane translocase 9-like protein-like [Scleropages formosus]
MGIVFLLFVNIMTAQVSESDQIKQFKEFLGTYNKLTENCFMDCVKDFTTREVKPEEGTCSESCLQKYLKMTQRISMRFQEYHIQQNEALAAKAGLLGQPRGEPDPRDLYLQIRAAQCSGQQHPTSRQLMQIAL